MHSSKQVHLTPFQGGTDIILSHKGVRRKLRVSWGLRVTCDTAEGSVLHLTQEKLRTGEPGRPVPKPQNSLAPAPRVGVGQAHRGLHLPHLP